MFRSPNHAGAAHATVRFCALVCCGALFFSAAGCRKKTAARIPAPARIGDTETGIASWYGEPYNGRRAASGEIFDMQQLVAAHRTLAFGTWLEVSDLDNGKKVDVRVIDRGPFVQGRIIDLSLAAARKIDMVGPGIARVRLKVIAPPRSEPAPPVTASKLESPNPEVPAATYSVQAGAFSSRDRADSFQASLRDQFEESRVEPVSAVWRVLVGRNLTLDDAKRLAEKVRALVGEAEVVLDR